MDAEDITLEFCNLTLGGMEDECIVYDASGDFEKNQWALDQNLKLAL